VSLSGDDSMMAKMEALRQYLEIAMGEDGFIEAYMEASSLCEREADLGESVAVSVIKALEGFAPGGKSHLGHLIGVLLKTENE